MKLNAGGSVHTHTPSREGLSFQGLIKVMLKACRNGGWRRLNGFERALFKASVELAKLRGCLVNPALVDRLKTIVSKLLQTPGVRILRLGRDYADHLLRLYSRNGVAKLIPEIKRWLRDPDYLLWLGVKQVALRSIGLSVFN
ncbi:MAG: hypothetical protein FGF50_11330 [Candidatus Brockarchaeota archaeon]|nr:hypothetical protein [Candidatus Brockarchaeota archaeon]